jgi:methionyl-tRNA formyltransferase
VVLKLDAGPLHASRSLRPLPGEARAALRARLGVVAGELAGTALPAILDGVSVPVPQDESLVTYARRLNRADAPLDFRQSAAVIRQRVLALEGWPGSTFDHQGVTIKVGAAQAEDPAASGAPGQILAADRSGVRVSCGQGVLVLTQLQRPGGKMLPVGEFLAGFPLAVGETLASAEMPAFVASAPFPRAPKS